MCYIHFVKDFLPPILDRKDRLDWKIRIKYNYSKTWVGFSLFSTRWKKAHWLTPPHDGGAGLPQFIFLLLETQSSSQYLVITCPTYLICFSFIWLISVCNFQNMPVRIHWMMFVTFFSFPSSLCSYVIKMRLYLLGKYTSLSLISFPTGSFVVSWNSQVVSTIRSWVSTRQEGYHWNLARCFKSYRTKTYWSKQSKIFHSWIGIILIARRQWVRKPMRIRKYRCCRDALEEHPSSAKGTGWSGILKEYSQAGGLFSRSLVWQFFDIAILC